MSYTLIYKLKFIYFYLIQVTQARKASEEDITNVEEDDVYTDLTRIENTVVNDLVLRDYNYHYNNGKCSQYYPVIDDVTPTTTTTTGSFVYDTTALTSNDTPLDFLGGISTSTNNYYNSKFGSFDVDNISLDDFY